MCFQQDRYPKLHKFDVDDTALNLDLGMVEELCDLIIASGRKIRWGGAALIRKEMDSSIIQKMARAGCDCIGYGLESGSQKIIDLIGKGFTIEVAERVIRDTYAAGIETILGIIIGFPGEEEKEFRQTLQFIARNKHSISWVHAPSECCIGCSSQMKQFPERFGAVLDPSEDGEKWRSIDGNNTHQERQRRIKVFNEFLREEGVRTNTYIAVLDENQSGAGVKKG
jgi:anaerobic magnesium-protoporphyrin IX monomethyl ester cyclase